MITRLGPVEDVQYDEHGRVISWAQRMFDEDGQEVGRIYPVTDHGRDWYLERAAARIDGQVSE